MIGEVKYNMEELKEESNTLEYKRSLPKDNKKWLKSIVSFSNTVGGELIVGVEDSTLAVVGIEEDRSIIEQRIIESIYSSIEPKVNVDIVFKNIDEKDIVIVRVDKGMETPYYLKKQGIYEGCYVRFGSTDQKATRSQIMELSMSKKRESYTNCIYDEQGIKEEVVEEDIIEFLEYINDKRKKSNEITKEKLIEWQIIRKEFDKIYVTNGYKLLTSNPFQYSKVRIGKFEGETRAIILKDEWIEGSIITQYEKTIEKVMDMLSEGYEIKRFREKKYKLPELAVREIIANAIIHRSYLEEQNINVSIYEDRIEVFSPGTLFDGLQLEDLMGNISKLRNPNIGEIFYHLGIIEKWGSGISRVNIELEKESLQPLEINTTSLQGVMVTMKFEKITPNKIDDFVDVEDYLFQKTSFTRKDLEEDLMKTEKQARLLIEKWEEKGKIEKQGKGRATFYEVKHK